MSPPSPFVLLLAARALPEVRIEGSMSRASSLSFDGLRTRVTSKRTWTAGIVLTWRPPGPVPGSSALLLGRDGAATAEVVARLSVARLRAAGEVERAEGTLAERVRNALRLAEIEARLDALDGELSGSGG